MVAAVGDVEHDAAAAGLENGGLEPGALVEDPRSPAVQEVTDDVAGAEEREHVGVLGRRVVDVDEHRHPGGLRRPQSAAQRLEPVLADHLGLLPHLDPDDHVPVLARHPGGEVGIRVVEEAMLTDRQVAQPDRRDVDEREHARLGPRDHVLAEPGEARRPGAPGVAERRHPAGGAHRVGVQPQVVGAEERVGVEVDQAGRDEGAADVDPLARRLGRDVDVHRRHAAGRERDVARAVDPGGRVDEPAALEQQVVAHGSSGAAGGGSGVAALPVAEQVADDEQGNAQHEAHQQAGTAARRVAGRIGEDRRRQDHHPGDRHARPGLVRPPQPGPPHGYPS